MLTVWDNFTLEKIDSMEANYLLTVRLRNRDSSEEWIYTNIYGPIKQNEKEVFWYELAVVGRNWDLPWCVYEDFDAPQKVSDRSGR